MLTFKNFMKTIDIRGSSPAKKSLFGRKRHHSEEDEEPLNLNQHPDDETPSNQIDQQQPSPEDTEQQPSDKQQLPTNEDPNRQGLIRTVKGAHLVYKRRTEEGDFEELWIYPINQKGMRTETLIRRDILSGTDIPEKQTSSEDGKQQLDLWTAGEAQLILITGLPN